MKTNDIPGQMSIFDFLKEEPKTPGTGGIFRYLRYGPHTVIPEAAEQTRQYLTENGVPDWVTWDKNSLPCENCTWYDGKTCRSGGHTCHYEFGYLICDGFYQSIVERKPETVGEGYPNYLKKNKPICKHSNHECNKEELWKIADSLDDIECPHACCRQCEEIMCGARCNGSEEPHTITPAEEYFRETGKTTYWQDSQGKPYQWWKIMPVDIKGICDDAYCPKCGRALDEYKCCDQDCPSCHARLDWTPWHKLNDDWWLKHLKSLDAKQHREQG